MYGEGIDAKEVYRGQDRDYEVSRDPEEWKAVEALLPPEVIPPVPEKPVYPSGFIRATAKQGDHPYFVHRTHVMHFQSTDLFWPYLWYSSTTALPRRQFVFNVFIYCKYFQMHMLPVYTRFERRSLTMTTKIKRADGNLFALRKDLDKMLVEKYGMEFISQVAEVNSSVTYRGDFEEEFKNFLISKGF